MKKKTRKHKRKQNVDYMEKKTVKHHLVHGTIGYQEANITENSMSAAARVNNVR